MLKNKFESLRELIKRDIIGGKYLPGTTLPVEAEFRKLYGANHSTINKAVASLASEGFIRTKPRNGSLVLPVSERKLSARLGIYVMRGSGHIFNKLNAEITNVLQMNHYFPALIDLDFIVGDQNHDWLENRLDEAIDSMPEFVVIDGQSGLPFEYFLRRCPDVANLIFVNRYETSLEIPSVRILSDYRRGGELAATRIKELGCRRPLVLLGMRDVLYDDINISHAELNGLLPVLKEAGTLPVATLGRNDPDYALRLKELFTGANPPDCIFADSDFTGYQTLRELETMGIRNRQDYHLIGYFDTPWSSESGAPFDTISINQQALAQKLDEVIRRRDFTKATFLIQPVLKTH